MNERFEGDRYTEKMKPPFMMLKSADNMIQINNTLVPGKLADESQLGQLTTLFTDNQQSKRFLAPKPPKKRYLEENYSQNKRTNLVLDNVGISVPLLNKNSEIPTTIPEVKKKKADENVLFPDVNPLLPDVVPKNDCKDIEARTSWRKKLLCWEKLDEIETTKGCERLQLENKLETRDANSGRLRNERTKKKSVNNHCPKDGNTANDTKPGRRGGARACKGQKYREFMWTNVMHQRRKSSRWELCQDTVESTSVSDEDTASFDKANADCMQSSKPEPKPRSSTISHGIGAVDSYYKKKKITRKKILEISNKKIEINKFKSKIIDSPRRKQLKREGSDQTILLQSSSNTNAVTGSKKRKLRRQSIRRLEPGSSFKDTSVVEDSGLATLARIAAAKMKLRSGNDN